MGETLLAYPSKKAPPWRPRLPDHTGGVPGKMLVLSSDHPPEGANNTPSLPHTPGSCRTWALGLFAPLSQCIISTGGAGAGVSLMILEACVCIATKAPTTLTILSLHIQPQRPPSLSLRPPKNYFLCGRAELHVHTGDCFKKCCRRFLGRNQPPQRLQFQEKIPARFTHKSTDRVYKKRTTKLR